MSQYERIKSVIKNKFKKPDMHCQKEIEADLKDQDFISDQTLLKWFNDRYSTSKHLLTLYSLVKGLQAKEILEIGFGRSSFVLAKAAHENNGHLTLCDPRKFEYLLSEPMKAITSCYWTKSKEVWKQREKGIDFAFLDYFSDENCKATYIYEEINDCLKLIKQNGMIAIHDSMVEKYAIKDALKQLKSTHADEIELVNIPFNYGLALIRKVGESEWGVVEDEFIKKAE